MESIISNASWPLREPQHSMALKDSIQVCIFHGDNWKNYSHTHNTFLTSNLKILDPSIPRNPSLDAWTNFTIILIRSLSYLKQLNRNPPANGKNWFLILHFTIILILPFYITLQFPFPVCCLFGDTSEIIIWNLAISLSGHSQANAKCCILSLSDLRISISNTLPKPNISLDT